MLEGVDKIESSVGGSVSRRDFSNGTLVGKNDGFGNAFSTGFGHMDAMAAIVFGSGAKIPPVYAMRGPGTADFRVFVDEDFGARRCHGSSVVVKSAVELRLGGKFGVDARGTQ